MNIYEEELIRMIKNLNNELTYIQILKRELESKLFCKDYGEYSIINKFEITNNLNDKILNDDLRKISNNISLYDLKRKLKTLGAIEYKTGNYRGLRGIKLKNN
jgi:hypothetical protein